MLFSLACLKCLIGLIKDEWPTVREEVYAENKEEEFRLRRKESKLRGRSQGLAIPAWRKQESRT